ncbi:MAG: hypothetical protein M5U09_25625 [Gammaproteobacteria bacterium]|nr:hypothetical protein [Gammaproteobacteria bacterium]
MATPDQFRLVTGEEELTRYVFGQERNHHYFAATAASVCLVSEMTRPWAKMYGVNIGCLEGVTEAELSRIPHYVR